jgi:hypothetical protein
MRDGVSSPRPPLELCWQAVHDKAGRVAAMADLAPERIESVTLAFTERLALAEARQAGLAAQAIGDIDSMLAMGLKALSVVEERGQDTTPPALALWREFYHAREGVLAALQPLAA